MIDSIIAQMEKQLEEMKALKQQQEEELTLREELNKRLDRFEEVLDQLKNAII